MSNGGITPMGWNCLKSHVYRTMSMIGWPREGDLPGPPDHRCRRIRSFGPRPRGGRDRGRRGSCPSGAGPDRGSAGSRRTVALVGQAGGARVSDRAARAVAGLGPPVSRGIAVRDPAKAPPPSGAIHQGVAPRVRPGRRSGHDRPGQGPDHRGRGCRDHRPAALGDTSPAHDRLAAQDGRFSLDSLTPVHHARGLAHPDRRTERTLGGPCLCLYQLLNQESGSVRRRSATAARSRCATLYPHGRSGEDDAHQAAR